VHYINPCFSHLLSYLLSKIIATTIFDFVHFGAFVQQEGHLTLEL